MIESSHYRDGRGERPCTGTKKDMSFRKFLRIPNCTFAAAEVAVQFSLAREQTDPVGWWGHFGNFVKITPKCKQLVDREAHLSEKQYPVINTWFPHNV
jgi:hypothetical protein